MATKPDYYIRVFQTDDRPNPWRRELHRHSSPMGINFGARGFRSQQAAEYAGKQALERFLIELEAEERRTG